MHRQPKMNVLIIQLSLYQREEDLDLLRLPLQHPSEEAHTYRRQSRAQRLHFEHRRLLSTCDPLASRQQVL